MATTFKNKGDELRFSLTHEPIWGWRGVIGSQFNQRNFSTLGEEAYIPSTNTKSNTLFILEEYQIGDFCYELDLRNEWRSIKNKLINTANNKNAMSLSAGVAWNFTENYNLNLSLSHTKRLPVAEELYANDPHLAYLIEEQGDSKFNNEKSDSIELSSIL